MMHSKPLIDICPQDDKAEVVIEALRREGLVSPRWSREDSVMLCWLPTKFMSKSSLLVESSKDVVYGSFTVYQRLKDRKSFKDAELTGSNCGS